MKCVLVVNERIVAECETEWCNTPSHGKKQFHSLRATVITCNHYVQINTCIPEKVITETSGHKSSKALWCNESTSLVQQQVVTASISNYISDPLALSCSHVTLCLVWSLPCKHQVGHWQVENS